MSLEKDITGVKKLFEADVFKPASAKEVDKRKGKSVIGYCDNTVCRHPKKVAVYRVKMGKDFETEPGTPDYANWCDKCIQRDEDMLDEQTPYAPLKEADVFKPASAKEAEKRLAEIDPTGYAECPVCKTRMTPNNKGCWSHLIDKTERWVERREYGYAGEEDTSEPCHDCGVREGVYHHDGCDNEQCPACGGQLLGCECDWVKIGRKNKASEAVGTETETMPRTEPTTTPSTPATPPRPSKPNTPIRQKPGIHPKPKATLNPDIELFLKKRGLTEAWIDSGDRTREWLDVKCPDCQSQDRIFYMKGGFHPAREVEHTCKKCGKKNTHKIEESKLNEADPLKGVHPQKKEWIKTGDESLNKLLPDLSLEQQKYLVTIASETYKETVKKIQDATGIQVEPSNYPALVGLMFQTLEDTIAIESTHKQQLEEMALDLVFSIPEFKIVEEAYLSDELGFDIKLGKGELAGLLDQEAPEEGLSKDEELNLDLANAWQGVTDENLKRKFANLLVTGGSYNKLHLYNMATEKLAKIDANLPTYYGILASVAQLGYWVTPFGIEQLAAGGEETSAGSEEVIPKGDKYIIKVRGSTFPYLVYELIKGVYEYLAMDPNQQVEMGKDTLEDETKDMIAGPGIYKAVASYIPADKQELLPIVQKKLTALEAEEIRDVLANNPNGRKIMDKLIGEAEAEMATYRKQKEEYRA